MTARLLAAHVSPRATYRQNVMDCIYKERFYVSVELCDHLPTLFYFMTVTMRTRLFYMRSSAPCFRWAVITASVLLLLGS
jgi:hypothetical protein